MHKHESIDAIDPETGLPYAFGKDGGSNVGDFNSVCQVLIGSLTLYLMIYDFTVLAANVWRFNEIDSAPSQSLTILVDVALHIIVLMSVADANDETIKTIEFWSTQSWVAMAIWIRFIVTYLGEIKEFSWLVGLI